MNDTRNVTEAFTILAPLFLHLYTHLLCAADSPNIHIKITAVSIQQFHSPLVRRRYAVLDLQQERDFHRPDRRDVVRGPL